MWNILVQLRLPSFQDELIEPQLVALPPATTKRLSGSYSCVIPLSMKQTVDAISCSGDIQTIEINCNLSLLFYNNTHTHARTHITLIMFNIYVNGQESIACVYLRLMRLLQSPYRHFVQFNNKHIPLVSPIKVRIPLFNVLKHDNPS